MSISPTVVERSEKAALTSYGVVVRETGIGSRRRPEPPGSRARNLRPSSVFTLIDAVVCRAERDVLGPEPDQHLVAVELELGDLADLHPGDPRLVAGT